MPTIIELEMRYNATEEKETEHAHLTNHSLDYRTRLLQVVPLGKGESFDKDAAMIELQAAESMLELITYCMENRLNGENIKKLKSTLELAMQVIGVGALTLKNEAGMPAEQVIKVLEKGFNGMLELVELRFDPDGNLCNGDCDACDLFPKKERSSPLDGLDISNCKPFKTA